MRDKKEVQAKHLREAIKVLNAEKFMKEKPVVHVGKNKDQLIEGLSKAIEGIPKGSKAPKAVATFYNWLFADEMEDLKGDPENPFAGGNKADDILDPDGEKEAKKKGGKRGISTESTGYKLAVAVYSMIKRRKTPPTLEEFTEEVKKGFPKMTGEAIKSELSKLRLIHKYMSGEGKAGTKMDTMINCLKEGKSFPLAMKHTTFTSRAYKAHCEVFESK